MKSGFSWHRFFRGLYSYLLFFLLAAFLVTCTTMLFVTVLASTLDVTLTGENLTAAAKLTFLNVILLSLLYTALDKLRRRLTTERITGQITEAAKKVVAGDFSVRLPPVSNFGADEQWGEIIDCFNAMAAELGSVETLRTDFIANVSHEMKTPLAVMQNYGTLLQSPTLTDEERMEYARGITDGSRRLADMMTNILKLNRLENQQIYPQISEFDLGEQICGCLLDYESVWEKSGIEIDTDIADDVRIRADAELLSLVWSNLFSNAFKFTSPGGRVSVSMTGGDYYAVVKVSDTGCGMTPEVGAHIFEKFYQGDTSHSAQGNGLGLALVKRIMDIVGGEISVTSQVGEGSTFTVQLRIARNEEQ